MRPAALSRWHDRVWHNIRRAWTVLGFAGKKIVDIDGEQLAGALALNVLFPLFPLWILLLKAVRICRPQAQD